MDVQETEMTPDSFRARTVVGINPHPIPDQLISHKPPADSRSHSFRTLIEYFPVPL